jgi:hypothetical protein
MGDHKNYRFCACHRALEKKKTSLFVGIKIKKLVFVTALIYTLNMSTREHPD